MPDFYIVHQNLTTLSGNNAQSWYIIYRASDDLEICRCVDEQFAITLCAAFNQKEITL